MKTPRNTHSSNTITFLGTSDGLPSPDRYHAALLLKLAGKTLLLDCGEPCSHTLKRLDADFNAIDAVCVTHTHSDHVGGLPMLLQSMWLEGRWRDLPVWLPRRAIPALRTWLDACYLFEEVLPFRVSWRTWNPAATMRVGNVRLRAMPNTHLAGTQARHQARHPRVGFEAFSLTIEAAGKRVVYSGDLGAADDLVPLLDEPVDVLVVELAHFHPDRLVAVLQGRPVRHVVLTHLGRPMRARLPAVRRCLRALRGTEVMFATDSLVVRF